MITRVAWNRSTTAEFIEKSISKHGNKYDYSKSIYETSKAKVIVICKIHGEFMQMPNSHLGGKGCNKCAVHDVHCKQRKKISDFLTKAKVVHGDKYDYSKVVYKSNSDRIEVVCKHHGSFFPTPKNHLKGAICLKCSCDPKLSKTRRGFNLFSNSGYGDFCKKLNKMPNIYLLKLVDGSNVLYKIGLSVDVKKRINHIKDQSKMDVKLLSSVAIFPNDARATEIGLHSKLKEYRYISDISFSGSTECFTHITSEIAEFFNIKGF